MEVPVPHAILSVSTPDPPDENVIPVSPSIILKLLPENIFLKIKFWIFSFKELGFNYNFFII